MKRNEGDVMEVDGLPVGGGPRGGPHAIGSYVSLNVVGSVGDGDGEGPGKHAVAMTSKGSMVTIVESIEESTSCMDTSDCDSGSNSGDTRWIRDGVGVGDNLPKSLLVCRGGVPTV